MSGSPLFIVPWAVVRFVVYDKWRSCFFFPRHHPESRQDTPRHHPETRRDTPETRPRHHPETWDSHVFFEKLTASADTNCCKQKIVRTGLKCAIAIQEVQRCHHPIWWYIAEDYVICLWYMLRGPKKPNVRRLRLSQHGLKPLILATYFFIIYIYI